MRNSNKVYVIFLFLGMLLLAASADHCFLAFSGMIAVVVAILLMSVLSASFQKGFLLATNWVVGDNNNIHYSAVLSTIILLICALWYGAGEPLFVTALRPIRDEWRSVYTEDVQKAVNEELMRGRSITDDQVDSIRIILAASGECPKKDVKQEGEDWDNHRQELNNYNDFGCFVNDATLDLIKNKPNVAGVQFSKDMVKNAGQKTTEAIKKVYSPSYLSRYLEPREDVLVDFTNDYKYIPNVVIKMYRTGFWWKAFFLFATILCPLSFVVSFHDEAANMLNGLLLKAKQFKESSNSTTASSSTGGTSTAEKVKEAVKDQGSLVMKILSVDIIAEMVQVLIKALKK